MLSKEERYRNDPVFARLVDALFSIIVNHEVTPTEMREAAMLAQIKYEYIQPRFVVYPGETEKSESANAS